MLIDATRTLHYVASSSEQMRLVELLESRIAIEQAKAILAEHMAITVDDAFTLLRNHARTHNSKLTETAQRVVSGALSPDTLGVSRRIRGG